jgi:membrane protease YdiL (CAAX protease family)
VLGFALVLALFEAPLVFGLHALPASVRAMVPKIAVLVCGMLLATAVCLKTESASFASVGLKLDARFARQLAAGGAIGIGLLLAAAVMVWLCGGFGFVGASRETHLIKGAAIELGIGVLEELAYRGYAFQRAIRGLGFRNAQIVFAILFVASHPLDAGMSVPAMAFAMLNIFTFAIAMGLLYRRTGSLALPIGVHAGWNWALQSLGFGVSGIASQGWLTPVYANLPDWVTGGRFGLEASGLTFALLLAAAVSLVRCTPRGVTIDKSLTTASRP